MGWHDFWSERAFTLVELLVVVSVIAILCALLLPSVRASVSSAQRTTTLSNMHQLGQALINFTMENNGGLPLDKGATDDKWSTAASGQNDSVWYNALPRACGMKGVGDCAASAAGKAEFYSGKSLFFSPTAKYPADKLTASSPYFSIAMNSKLIQANSQARMSSISQPAKTVAFLENGLPQESKFRPTQSAFNGQPTAFASRFVARYAQNKQGIIVFFDGHASLVDAEGIVAPAGKAYFPQLAGGGTVLWTADPDLDANN